VNGAAEVIKEYFIPGSAWFLIISGSVCAVLLFGARRARRAGRTLLAAIVLIYWLMSLPLVARTLQAMHHPPLATTAAELPTTAEPIVILGNGLGGYDALGGRIELPLGQTAMNTLFGLDRYRHYPQSLLIASGGSQPGIVGGTSEARIIADALHRNGVPAEHILLEESSHNTHEQAVATARLLKDHGARRCIVVTTPQQMTRALDLFRGEGIDAIPLVAGALMWSPSQTALWWSWIVPTTQARAVSRDVVYELMAWPYYWLRGWVR
jgi:uncharacterized SAM-binding protein YcdF (DUF218 family)